MQSDDDRSFWESALSLVLKPRLLLQAIVEYLSAWLFTRRWVFWLLVLAPAWSLVAAAVGLTSYGAFLDNQTLTERYAEWIEEEVPDVNLDDGATNEDSQEQPDTAVPLVASSDASQLESLDAPATISRYGDLLLRRLLVLKDFNSRISYLVATQLAREDRIGQARQLMRRVAPQGGGGLPQAHAWLAVDTLRAGNLDEQALEELTKDLETASRWSGLPVDLLAVYSGLLEKQGKIGDALNLLESVAERDSRFTVELAAMSARHGRSQRQQRATTMGKTEIRGRIEAGTESLEDIISLANIFLLEKDPDRALQAIGMGFQKDSDNATLRRQQSNAYLMKYGSTMKTSDGSLSVNLAFLDQALKSDPTNPNVGAEVARLIAAGATAPDDLKEALQTQLASGSATAVTHVLLANRLLQDGKLAEAIPHLRIANRQAPNNALIQNNLALALTRTQPENLQEAVQLIDAAISVEPTNANYLNTQGEIREASGDLLGAVESYEKSIGYGPDRIESREALVTLFKKLGMQEMAAAQQDAISKLRSSDK